MDQFCSRDGGFEARSRSWLAPAALAGVFLLPALAFAQFGPTPSLGAATSHAALAEPQAVAVADFNHDGVLDLAVVNLSSGGGPPPPGPPDHVSVLLGTGTGGFAPAVSFQVGNGPVDVAAGDVNRDGHVDIVTANGYSNNVTVLLGDGLGNFPDDPPPSFTAENASVGIAIGEVTGDAFVDLVVVNSGSDSISVLRGTGVLADLFADPVNYDVGIDPRDVALAHLNGDGLLDVIVTNFGVGQSTGTGGGVSVLLNAAGTLGAAVNIPTGNGARTVAVGHFNPDDFVDVAVTNRFSASVSVLLGVGDGTFQAVASFAAGVEPLGLALGDFNVDSKTDVAVSNYAGTTVTLLNGNGAGALQTPGTAFATGLQPIGVGTGDFNGDGKPDLVVPNFGSANVSVLLNTLVLEGALTVTNTDGQPTAVPGSGVTYTITVANAGPNTMSRVRLTDTLPAALLNPVFTPATGSYNPGTGAWTGIKLTPGGSVSMTLSATINPAATGTLVHGVTVAVIAPDIETNTGNNTASDTDTLVPSADLVLTKTGPAAVAPGLTVTYTITVTNLGPSNAATVLLADPTPVGLAFVSNTGACTTLFPCNLGTMAVGQVRTITTTFAIGVGFLGSTLSNTAAASSTTADPASSNNSAIASSTVSNAADLALTQTGPATVNRGHNLVYTITVTNNGPANAAAVAVTSVTPPGLTFVSNGGACSTDFPCALGLLASGATRTITATFLVPASYSGSDPIQNVASVSSTTGDSHSTNNAAMTSTSLGANDLALHTLAPCRILDTRRPADGPAVAPGSARRFAIAGVCGVPVTALSVSLNVTVTAPTHAGDLRLYPAGSALPQTSTINYAPGQTRANSAVIKLGGQGLDVVSGQAGGTVHLILDVNAYFQ